MTALRKSFLGLLAFIVLLMAGLYVYLTPERLRAMIVPRLSEALDRSVAIDTVSLSLWGGVYAVVDGLEVAERAGFGDVPFLSAPRTEVAIPLLAILTGSDRLGSVRIVSPTVSLVVDENGKANYADLLEDEDEPAQGSSVALPVNQIALSNATLVYDDRMAGTQTLLRGLDLNLAGALEAGGVRLAGDGRLADLVLVSAQDTLRSGPVGFAFDALSLGDSVAVRSLRLSRSAFEVGVSGGARFDSVATELDLRLRANDTPIADLAGFLPPGSGLSGRATADLTLAGRILDDGETGLLRFLSGTLSFDDVEYVSKDLPHPLQDLSARLRLSPERIEIERLTASTAGTGLTISGRIRDWWRLDGLTYPATELQVVADRIETSIWIGDEPAGASFWDGIALTTPAYAQTVPDAASKQPVDLELLKSLDLQIRFESPTIILPERTLTGLKLAVGVDRGTVTVESLSLESRDIRARLSGRADFRSPAAYTTDLNGTVTGLDLALLVPLMATPGATLEGEADLDFRLAGSLDATLEPTYLARDGQLVSPRVSARVSARNVRYGDPYLAVPVQIRSAEATVRADTVSTVGIDVEAGRSRFTISGDVAGFLAHTLVSEVIRPRMRLEVRSPFCDLNELAPPVDPQAGASAARDWSWVARAHAASPSVDETSVIIPIVHYADGPSELDFETLITDSITVSDLRARAVARDGILEVQPISAKVYDGTVSGHFKLDVTKRAGPYPIQTQLDIRDAEANALLAHNLDERIPVFGKVNVLVGMNAVVDSVFNIVRKDVVAAGGVAMQKGRILNWDWLKRSLGRVDQLGFLSYDEIPIQTLQAPFRIANERVIMNDFTLNAADVACRLGGSIGLDGTLDAILDVWIPANRLSVGGLNVGSALSGLFGKAEDRKIPLRVVFGGTTDRPSVSATVQPEGTEQFDKTAKETEKKLFEDAKTLLKKQWKRN